jgi:hypothetical protein
MAPGKCDTVRLERKVAILDAGSAAAGHGVDIVAAELSSEVYRPVFVKKDAH